MNDEEKKNALSDLIDVLCDKEFANNKETISEWIQHLNEIYSDKYRHNYADLFTKLQDVFSRDSEVSEILGENLNILGIELDKSTEIEDNRQAVIDGYKKFADHIRLEIGRYNFFKRQFEKNIKGNSGQGHELDFQNLEGRVNNISKDFEKVRSITTEAKKVIDNLDSKLENNKVSSITTLTIFSAVVLAFSGGITFEVGMLQGMQAASKYRLLFVIALTGFILFNTIFVLLYLIGKLAGKPISTKCKYIKLSEEDMDCQSCGTGYCTRRYNQVSICCKIIHKYSYVAMVDVCLLWVMYSAYIFWLFQPLKFSYTILFFLLLPLMLLFSGVYLGGVVRRRIQKKRNILSAKINLINQLLHPTNIEDILFEAFNIFENRMTGRRAKTIVDEFRESVLSDKKEFKQISKETDLFIEKRILHNNLKIKNISYEEYKFNKMEWSKLSEELKRYYSH